jgi:ABC-2 type transport system permease protein
VSALAGHAGAAQAVLRRDLRIYGSYRMNLASQILRVVFTVTLFYYISRLVHFGAFNSSDAYFEFVMVGIVVLQMMVAMVGVVPTTLRQELVAGTFERFVVSPLGPIAGVMSMMIFPLISTIGISVFVVAFAKVAFGLGFGWGAVALSIPLSLLTAVAFAPLALLLCGAVIAIKQRTAGTAMVIALLSLVAGFYFPVSILPGWIRWASEVQPFTPALDLMRHAVVSTPLREAAWVEIVKLVGFGALFGAIGVIALKAAVEIGRRRGTIIEY